MEKTASAVDPDLTFIHVVYALLASIVVMGIVPLTFQSWAGNYSPEPQFFIRLAEVDGLDPLAQARSPVFRLSVEVDGVWENRRGPCAGGGDEMLRLSYHGVILAWGSVPRFCLDGRSGPNACVASVVARSEGSELRAEMRNMIHAETQALGKAEFDVDGELPGLGRLRCKTYLFQGEPTETALPPCRVKKA